jgi:hypothetical protein
MLTHPALLSFVPGATLLACTFVATERHARSSTNYFIGDTLPSLLLSVIHLLHCRCGRGRGGSGRGGGLRSVGRVGAVGVLGGGVGGLAVTFTAVGVFFIVWRGCVAGGGNGDEDPLELVLEHRRLGDPAGAMHLEDLLVEVHKAIA